ncbi:MAG: UDP-N-acetylmuramoyl-tripeptide--D-alanyl-D-alanine ligase [Caldisericia bacterium]|nr:UDP-N-acetylmuramoyl-tripeptide--D-alanyl-D-alanine ligase [Caldisericia bacterium]
MNLTIKEIAEILGSDGVFPDTQVTGFAVDSRIVNAGEVFFCIKGSESNGHDYTSSAQSNGAILIISEKQTGVSISEIVVGSASKALIKIAHHYIQKFNIDIVGITGSAGKTTTKELTAEILFTKYNIEKNEGNKNTPIGIPISLKYLKPETEIFVAELSGSHFDEIPQLLQILTPKISVVTNVGETHLERLGNVEGVAKAKGHLISTLPVGGVAIFNADDELVMKMANLTRCKVVTFGIKKTADISGELIGNAFVISAGNLTYSIKPKTPTIHFLYDALAAIAVSLEYGIDLKKAVEVVGEFEPVEGRGRVIITAKGVNIIDETYNANPVSMKETLKSLEAKSGRRFAVVADMLQMGKETIKIHKELGEYISKLRLDGVFCFGKLSKHVAESCPIATHFEKIDELVNTLNTKLKKDDWVLVKGSNSMNMIEVVNSLK